jgi:hypothetical protein
MEILEARIEQDRRRDMIVLDAPVYQGMILLLLR